jgi:hypothetical protein
MKLAEPRQNRFKLVFDFYLPIKNALYLKGIGMQEPYKLVIDTLFVIKGG